MSAAKTARDGRTTAHIERRVSHYDAFRVHVDKRTAMHALASSG